MRARISIVWFSLTFPNPIFNADSVKLWAGSTRQLKAEEALLLEIQEPEVSQQSEWSALSGYHITPRSLTWEIIITQHSRKSLFQEKKKNAQFIMNTQKKQCFYFDSLTPLLPLLSWRKDSGFIQIYTQWNTFLFTLF